MKRIITQILSLFILVFLIPLQAQSVTNLKSMVGEKNMKVKYTNMEVNFCSECVFFGKISYTLHEEPKESFICLDAIREDIYEFFDDEIISIKGRFNGLICEDGLMHYIFDAQFVQPEKTLTRNLLREKLPELDPLFPFSEEEYMNFGFSITMEEAKEALAYHNQIRSDVGVEPLSWSNELSLHAQDWADHLATSNQCEMKHRPKTGEWQTSFGENIYKGFDEEGTNYALRASELWYSEIETFKNVALTESNWYETGHYTQMVWRKTKQVGMGMATCEDGSKIVVANYNPAGNFMGQKAY